MRARTSRSNRRALILALGSLLALALSACAKRPDAPNVLLITVDTLRADRFGDLTPELSAFAAGGRVYTHCQSPRAKTTPAVATLMTGLYPHDHGVRDLTTPLAPSVPVLAERFRRGGYRTAAIIGNYVLRDEFSGLERGFQTFVEDMPQALGVPPDEAPQRTARSLTDGALRLFGLAPAATEGAGPRNARIDGEAPWFVWLHYMDPHGLYDPPAEFLEEEREPAWMPQGSARRWVAEYNVPADARGREGIDTARMEQRYDGEVRYVDRELGRLLSALEAGGLVGGDEETIVVFTADHGESLGEHDYWYEHGRYAFEAGCRVPLFIRRIGGASDDPAADRVDRDVSLADIGPTLLEWCDLGPMPGLNRVRIGGRSLEERDEELPVFCEKIERSDKAGVVQTKAVRRGDWKLLHRYALVERDRGGSSGKGRELLLLTEELFDLATDPAESINRIGAPGEAPLDALRGALYEFTAADEGFVELADDLQKKREDLRRRNPEALRVFEALGY